MTKDLTTPVEAFIAKATERHPHLAVACDAPEHPTGSTFIDIRIGRELIVIEHRSDRGFGFSSGSPGSGLFGTPSAVFFSDVEEAFAHLERLLSKLLAGVDTAGRRGE